MEKGISMAKERFYIVHSTVVDPKPDSTYGTSAPHKTWKSAYTDATAKRGQHRQVYITRRDQDGNILETYDDFHYPDWDAHVHNVRSMEAGDVRRCIKVACHAAGNGRECWTIRHKDGTYSFGFESEAEAQKAVKRPPRDDFDWRANHERSLC